MKRLVVLAALASFMAAAAPVAPSALAAPPALDAKGESDREAGSSSKVDVNRAGVEELRSLPGIGPSLAERIVQHRQEHGPFRTVDELLAVKGIGPKLLGKIRHRLTVGEGGKRP